MAYVILGLLHISRMSQYDLIKAFEAGISLFYAASSGSIKRALDGLLRDGSIVVADEAPAPRGRKAYEITPAGRARFLEWMKGDITGEFEAAALSRLYFFGYVEPEDRRQILAAITGRLESELGRLQALSEVVDATDVPDELRVVARYQRATLDYGLSSVDHALRWLQEQEAREVGD